MKNEPNKIFLQTALKEYGETFEDFNELDESLMSWCSDKIYEDDLQYISSNFISARIKELEIRLINTNPKRKETVLRRQEVIDELKNLLK